MEHRDDQNQSPNQQADLSKAQNQQQPQGQQNQQQPEGQSQQQPPEGQSQQQQPEGQADYGSAGQSDTASQQRTDIEGGTSTGQATDIEGGSQFLGSRGASDTSAELVEDDESSDFAKDGQGAAE